MHKVIFVIHLIFQFVGFLSFIFASLLALLYFAEQKQLKQKVLKSRHFFPLDQVDRYSSTLTSLGFFCLTFANITGLYLAHYYWHDQWLYNPKLILSFVVWFWYLLVMWMKKYKGLKGTKFLLSMVVGLALLCFVFLATFLWSSN